MPCTASTGVMLYNFNLPQRLYSVQFTEVQWTVYGKHCKVYSVQFREYGVY